MENSIFSKNFKNEAQKPTVLGYKPSTGNLSFSKLFKPYGKKFIYGFLLLLGTNTAALTLPTLINGAISLVDQGLIWSPQWLSGAIAFSSVISISVLMIIFVAIGAVFRIYSRIVIFDIGRSIERDVRKFLFSHLVTLSNNFFREKSVGETMSLCVSDVSNIRLSCGFSVLNALNLVIVFAGTIPMLFMLNPLVASVALTPFLLVMLGAWFISRRMFDLTQEYQAHLSIFTGTVQQGLSALSMVRLFQQETPEAKRFQAVNAQVFESGLKLAGIRVSMYPLMRILCGTGVAMTILFGGRAVLLQQLSLGDFVEINTRLLQLSWPAISIGFIVASISRGQASLTRINSILSVHPRVVDGPVKALLNGNVKVNQLTVRIGTKILLSDLNFSVTKGGSLGVVGRIGSGKSVLANALVRESEIGYDQIFYDDHDILEIQLQSLFSQVILAPSEPYLFSMTIRENISFGNPTATEKEINQVIRLTTLEQDISNFPKGLETLVGERGITLSGGQRQRVALARSVLARPKILILDDCLSAVDVESQILITRRLREYGEIPTFIIVTHRLSAITHANEIIVLDKGRIIERGSHEALLRMNGAYSALWGVEQIEQGLKP